MEVNLVVLSGTTAAPAEHRVFDSGAELARLLVTVRSESPSRRVDVIPMTVWDPSPDLLTATADRGVRVWVAGAVQRRFWDSDGSRKSRLEVVAHHVEVPPPDGETPDSGGLGTGSVSG